ncbi:MAG: RES family NAD+ phosphorylase [Balneolaceae bacterium]
MLVYRITTAKWARHLTGSGYPARWNSRGKFVIYTAGSRALACLENLVHRSGEGFNALFKISVINIPDSVSRENLYTKQLRDNWNLHSSYTYCQEIGNRWLDEKRSCILQVPSSIIAEEQNILINPVHPEFGDIYIQSTGEFLFDNRLINK